MTKELAVAYLSRNDTTPEGVSALLRSVHTTLRELAAQEELPRSPAMDASPAAVPKFPIEETIGPDFVRCLECGSRLKTLRFHLEQKHGLSEARYRAKWGLAGNHPLIAPNFAAHRSALAIKSEFGRSRSTKR